MTVHDTLVDNVVDDLIWDCDWEEDICPVCGHALDQHDARTITRCANAR